MTRRDRLTLHQLCLACTLLITTAGLLLPGCRSERVSKPAEASEESAEPSQDETSSVPYEFANLLGPFDPPTLDELDATAGWEDQPVLDGMDIMREKQATEGDPPLPAEQALALRNNSPEDNEKIAKTLGRLAPADGAGVDYSAKLVRHSNGEIKSTNPVLASTATDQDYHNLSSIGLMSFDDQFNFFAPSDVVKSWRRSADGLMDKIVLRDDLTWSDGKPITAHDVVFTLQVILTEAVPIPALRTDAKEVKGIKAYDDHTLVFFHKEAAATNVSGMSFPLLPKHKYEDTIAEDPTLARSDAHRELEDNPVTGGPYELVSRLRGQEFVLKRRESYYMHNGKQVRQKPYFEEIRFKNIEDQNTALLALKKGSIHETLLLPDQWTGQTNDDDFYRLNTKVSGLSWTSYYIVWNEKTPYFEDRRVRKAMSLAIDYDEMIDRLFFGLFQRSSGVFHPSSWMFPSDGPEPMSQDLDEAARLLDEAGWTDEDGDGYREKVINGRKTPFRFTLMCHQIDMLVRLNTLVKENLDELGVQCIVKPTEFTVCVDKTRKHEFQAYQGVWGSGADPNENRNIFGTGEGRNYGYYSNPEVDRLYEEGRRTLDRQERAKIYGQIHKLMWEDQPYTWLLFRNSFYGFNKKLRGYNFCPRDPFSFSPGVSSIYQPAKEM
ncbi:MAG: peptide ABC transporter substrate-binding protein [Planctomycetales bacterium]|nr:peptide ABC transporter substrate-binding protein [Planctomycetales bacterium]